MALLFYTIGGLSLIKSFFSAMTTRFEEREVIQVGEQKRCNQSISGKGNCLDKAVMENFFGILRSELFYIQEFKSYKSLQQAIVEYVHYYSHDRIKLKLKGLSPVQHRTQAA